MIDLCKCSDCGQTLECVLARMTSVACVKLQPTPLRPHKPRKNGPLLQCRLRQVFTQAMEMFQEAVSLTVLLIVACICRYRN